MRWLILAALLPLPVAADPVHEWGTAPDVSALRLERCPDADCWQVIYTNRVSTGGREHVTLDRPGIVVGVELVGRDGNTPDTFSVVPPLGYVAEPPSVTVEDGAEGVITVAPVPIG